MSAPEIRLRPLGVADAPVLAGWAKDREFCREAGWSTGLDQDAHLTFWQRHITRPPADLVRLGAVSGEDLVGYVDLHGSLPRLRELGVLIGVRDRWGQGLGLQTARAALAHAFQVLHVDEVWAETLDANTRSVRLLRRLGMQETGRGEAGRFLGQPTFYRRFTTESPTPAQSADRAPGAGDCCDRCRPLSTAVDCPPPTPPRR
ncbi:GNAT family N-acetyltransferase [Aquipuribacter hungaricus]|uniref:GNAT family N-acetyltransferase n=1 Tax=Aquipuribacter hungaricus TaxID=545624 RepID=UPI0030EF0925